MRASVARCPIPRDPDAINPKNNMPVLSQLPGPNQISPLPIERAISSIPRTAGSVYGGVDVPLEEGQH